jgi:hypothetical protein
VVLVVVVVAVSDVDDRGADEALGLDLRRLLESILLTKLVK